MGSGQQNGPSDNGKRLTCRAENTKLKNSAIEDVFGANLDPSNIAEGNDVYFECNISSNPPVYKIVWRHN
ncbi:Nephrin, partial [Caligus rogercresseyi]